MKKLWILANSLNINCRYLMKQVAKMKPIIDEDFINDGQLVVLPC